MRTIHSFVRREGRITRAQEQALVRLWPRYGLEADARVDFDACFQRHAPRTLEIGFGNGDTLAGMADQEPATDFIGIEVHRPGIGHLLLELERRELGNVRVICADAVQVLKNCLPDAALDRVLLFFPDPWPKKRHHKRRIVQRDFVELLARKLRTGGILHMATDWEDYAQHMLDVMAGTASFRNQGGPPPRAPAPDPIGWATSGAVASHWRMKPTIAWISASVMRSPQEGMAVPGTPNVMICCKAMSLVSVRKDL